MMTDMESITLPAVLDSLSDISQFVGELAQTGHLPVGAAYRLRLAADEIATNIVVHGYGDNGTDEIEVSGHVEHDRAWLCLADTAPPFDPTSVPDPSDLNRPLSDRSIGGLGIYLTRTALDEFSYARVGDRNEITLGVVRDEKGK